MKASSESQQTISTIKSVPESALVFRLRVGTTWEDVVSRCVDTVSIEEVIRTENTTTLMLSHLTPNAATTVQRTTNLLDVESWEDAETFVPTVRTTNWVENLPEETAVFYRVITK